MAGIFLGAALLMSAYEFAKEIYFKGTLTMWGAHTITVIVTATFVTAASFFMRKWALKVDEQLRVAATAFETQEGMVVTDAHSVILRVNHAFTRITGYTAADAIGQTPRMLNRGTMMRPFMTRYGKASGAPEHGMAKSGTGARMVKSTRNISPSPK